MKTVRTASGGQDDLELIRSICRAVIRRVMQEHPGLDGVQLLDHLRAAAPFPSNTPDLEEIWLDEMVDALCVSAGSRTFAIH